MLVLELGALLFKTQTCFVILEVINYINLSLSHSVGTSQIQQTCTFDSYQGDQCH